MRKPLILATLTLALLAACGRDPAPPPAASGSGPAPQTALGRHVAAAIDEARKELQQDNISLGSNIQIGARRIGGKSEDGLPKGEISPAGDLLIDGKAVPVDASQRALLLEYRGHVVAIAEAGMALGVQGADLGMQAAGEAIRGIFSGNPDQVEARIKTQAAAIEAEAMKLCDRLPAMRDTQDRLAAALPAFKPYARMDQSDVDDCHTSARDETTREEVKKEIQSAIREGLRGGDAREIANAVGTAAAKARDEARRGNAAEQAEADSVAR